MNFRFGTVDELIRHAMELEPGGGNFVPLVWATLNEYSRRLLAYRRLPATEESLRAVRAETEARVSEQLRAIQDNFEPGEIPPGIALWIMDWSPFGIAWLLLEGVRHIEKSIEEAKARQVRLYSDIRG